VRVDRIEVASCRVSEGEHATVRLICDWARSAGWLDRIEVLGLPPDAHGYGMTFD